MTVEFSDRTNATTTSSFKQFISRVSDIIGQHIRVQDYHASGIIEPPASLTVFIPNQSYDCNRLIRFRNAHGDIHFLLRGAYHSAAQTHARTNALSNALSNIVESGALPWDCTYKSRVKMNLPNGDFGFGDDTPLLYVGPKMVVIPFCPSDGVYRVSANINRAFPTQPGNALDMIFEGIVDALKSAMSAEVPSHNEADRGRWIADQAQLHTNTITTLQQNILANMNSINQTQHLLNSYVAAMTQDARTLKQLQNSSNDERAATEWDNILGLLGQMYESVRYLGDNKMRVVTKPVQIRNANLGRFTVNISLSTGDMRFAATDGQRLRRGASHFHPHISADGYPCLGNLSRTLPEMFQKREYEQAFTSLFAYLNSYNPGDAYSHIPDEMPRDGDVPPPEDDEDDDSYYCTACDERVHPDDSFTCEYCYTIVCDTCVTTRGEDTTRYYCSDQCAGDAAPCTVCGTHNSQTHCHGCEDLVCNDCVVSVCHVEEGVTYEYCSLNCVDGNVGSHERCFDCNIPIVQHQNVEWEEEHYRCERCNNAWAGREPAATITPTGTMSRQTLHYYPGANDSVSNATAAPATEAPATEAEISLEEFRQRYGIATNDTAVPPVPVIPTDPNNT